MDFGSGGLPSDELSFGIAYYHYDDTPSLILHAF